jgi:uridine kinase
MTKPEAPLLPFDVLSYPRDARITNILVDDGNQQLTDQLSPHVAVLGRRSLSASEPTAAAQYAAIAVGMGSMPERAMLVTDRPGIADEVLRHGMGAATVADADAAQRLLGILTQPQELTDDPLYAHPLYTDFSYTDITRMLARPGEIRTIGVVGRTGAGKSTAIRRLIDAAQNDGERAGLVEVDAFFKRSRADRKAWLNEPGISDEERTDRRRVLSWWDLGRTTDTLMRLRAGEHVRLEGLYDMRKGGEMVGTLDIDPGTAGCTVFVEGTALLAPEFDGAIDSYIYFNTHDAVREQQLMERNLRDGYTAEESRERKALTDAAETNDHIAQELRMRRFAAGSLAVLDNTNGGERLRLLPPYIPRI